MSRRSNASDPDAHEPLTRRDFMRRAAYVAAAGAAVAAGVLVVRRDAGPAGWHPAGPDGRGGTNAVVGLGDGSVLVGFDVAGCAHYVPGRGAHKCSAGAPGTPPLNQKVASLTPLPDGRALVATGTTTAPGRAFGQSVRVFDPATHTHGPVLTDRFVVNAQNSSGWGWPVAAGNPDKRSVGTLVWRYGPDLVAAQFVGGVGYWSAARNGVRVIPGTEGWYCRSMVPIGGARFAVANWGASSAIVDVATDEVTPILPGKLYVEGFSAGGAYAACRDDGIWRVADDADVTYDLPRASWWRDVAVDTEGTLWATCANPQPFDGGPASVVALASGATGWRNLTTDPVDWRGYWSAGEGAGSVPARCLGGEEAVFGAITLVEGIAYTIGGSGVLYGHDGAAWTCLHEGMGVIALRDLLVSGTDVVCIPCKDLRAVLSRDGGSSWSIPPGATGSNNGASGSVGADGTLYLVLDDGKRYAMAPGATAWSAYSGTVPPKPPQPRATTDGTVVSLDGEPLSGDLPARLGEPIEHVAMLGDDVLAAAAHGLLRYGRA